MGQGSTQLQAGTVISGVIAWLGRHARLLLVVYFTALTCGTHWPHLQLGLYDMPATAFDEVLQFDKVLHVVGFGGLMLLALMSKLAGEGRPWRVQCAVALFACLVYAVLNEWSQGAVPGRSTSLADLLANAIAIIGVYLLAVLPTHQADHHYNRLLLGVLALVLPVVMVMLLSPWAMMELIVLRNEYFSSYAWIMQEGDHYAHFFIALVMSVLVFKAWPMASRRPRRAAFWALSLMLLSGPGIEVLQHFTGRGVEGRDVFAHELGVLLAMMGWVAWLAIGKPFQAPAEPAPDTGGSA